MRAAFMARSLVLGASVSAAACAAPDDALVWSCRTSALSVITECELSAKILNQSRSAYPDANTKNFKVRVSARFSVEKGRVDVAIPGCGEVGRAEVAPDRPATIECDAAINRSTFRFEVEAKPGEGGAAGFAGHLSFKAI